MPRPLSTVGDTGDVPAVERILAAAALGAPCAIVDEDALWANAAELTARADGFPVRVVTGSVRSRSIIKNALTLDGFRGLMTYSLAESIWWADQGVDDILLAYPTVHREALLELAAQDHRLAAVTLTVDSTESLDVIDHVLGADHPIVDVAIDVDSSYHVAGARAGVRRSLVRTRREVKKLARAVVDRPGFDLVGLIFYDARITDRRDSSLGFRMAKRRYDAELRSRRAKIVTAVNELADLRFVNAGGSGSLSAARADSSVTELAAGSGLFAPTLLDDHRALRPAAFFALPVVRKPARDVVTCFGGGYIASGAMDESRLPRPVWPAGLSLLDDEGAGEVQTPLRGKGARDLAVGDVVLFRHAKAGELCERFDELAIVGVDGRITQTPTYRGEGKNFG